MDKTNPIPMYNLALIYEQVDDKEKMLKYLKKSAALGFEEAAELLKNFTDTN